MPMPVSYENSAEAGWLEKKVIKARLLDDMTGPSTWSCEGQMTFPAEAGVENTRRARVKVNIHDQQPVSARGSGLPTVGLKRSFPGEDWRGFNRLSFRVRPELSGFNMLSLLGRDKVTSVEFRYGVNKRIPAPEDSISFDIERLELQRVDPDHYEGWSVAPGRISFSHTGYQAGASKTALASGLQARREDPVLLKRLLEEARWGLHWVLKVRFEGGYRIGFANMNIWTNGVIGDEDDRTRAALNNPNVNYLAASAEAIAWNVLRNADPELAAHSLRAAEEDWRHAVAGTGTKEHFCQEMFWPIIGCATFAPGSSAGNARATGGCGLNLPQLLTVAAPPVPRGGALRRRLWKNVS